MKTPTVITLLTVAGLAMALAEPAVESQSPAMKVHEWGTFTVVQGSDGRPIEWYQAPSEIVDLPPFVHQNALFSKSRGSSGLDLLRMETPVLYFYPEGDQPIDIEVTAELDHGRITEVFPPAFSTQPSATIWRGSLLPPDSPERGKVPAAEGSRGRHYAAARAVPDAWLFRGRQHPKIAEMFANLIAQQPDHPALPEDPTAEPIDHFIFYRGAGNPGGFSIQARQDEGDPNEYTLKNTKKAAIPKLFALRVVDGKGSWVAISNLQQARYSREGTLNEQSVVFSEPTLAVPEMAKQLRSAMVTTLSDEGLTKDEATAMVATWDDLWFTEPGTRVLAVLPQIFADEMVPLKISPTPAELDRVFVARLELINREQEAELMALLNDPEAKPDQLSTAAAKLESVELGRYSAGGMERAMHLVTEQMRRRFYALKEEAGKTTPAQKFTVSR